MKTHFSSVTNREIKTYEKGQKSSNFLPHTMNPIQNSKEITDDHIRLVFRAANGDRAAYAKIYELYRPAVLNYLRSRSSHSRIYELEDMIQEAFCDAYMKIERFTGESSVKTWLFGFAAIAYFNQRRRRNRESGGGGHRNQLGSIAPILTDPHDQLEHKEQIEWLKKMMSMLPLSDQEIINLRFHCGLSHKQISDVLRCSEKAAKCRYSRILHKLKNLLK